MPNRRAGITISTKGQDHPWGYWLEAWDSTKNPFTLRAGMVLDSLENIAAPLHHMYRGIIEKKRDLIIPTPEIRLVNARNGIRQLGIANTNIAKIADDVTKHFAKVLRPFSYAEGFMLKAGPDAGIFGDDKPAQGFAGRRELREIFRGLDATQRREALKDERFTRAILEQAPLASGLSQAEFNLIERMVLEEKFPGQLREKAEAEEAVDCVKLAATATDSLFRNELAELGQPAVDAGPPVFASTFSGAPAHGGNGSMTTQ
jgi:hypothetical protein